jgi:hypothetical protein
MHIKFVFGKLYGRDYCGDIDILRAVCSVQLPQDGAHICEHVKEPFFIQRHQDSNKLIPVKDKIKCMREDRAANHVSCTSTSILSAIEHKVLFRIMLKCILRE